MLNGKNIARRSLAVWLFCAGAVAIFALEGALQGPFVIRSVDFDVQGRSLVIVLRQKIEAEGTVIGRSFEDEASLESFIEDRRMALSNNRVLASVEASREISANPSGGMDVALRFAVVDTWNIIALPDPKYDSNKGLTLYIKARDYNFFGSMQSLELNLSYVSDTLNNKSFELGTSFSLPFQALGSDWSIGFSEGFHAWTDGTLASSSSVSLTYNIPGLGFPSSATATQSLHYNFDQPIARELDPWFIGEYIGVNASIPLGFRAGVFGAVYYKPTISMFQNWWPGTELLLYGRPGLGLGFTNTLSAGRIDWSGNMKKGASAELTFSPSYSFHYSDFLLDLRATALGFAVSEDAIGIAAKFTSRARLLGNFPDDNYIDLGADLRGVLDSRAVGVAGLYANVSVPIKLFDFPAHLVIKKNWLDFEFQVQPFLDAGLVLPSWEAKAGADWLWATGGLELLVFPAVMRSFIFRVSAGWDLRSVIETRSLIAPTPRDGASPYELYFGTGLAY